MKAAFYECDITPPLGCFLWGHYDRRFAEDVMDRLYAKALVVESEGELAAILSVDVCAPPHDMHDVVTKRIQEFTGIAPERVCITANHTHWGAPVFSSPELNCYRDDPYTDVFFRLCADAVILAYKRLQESSASFGKTELHGYSFNRDYVLENGMARTFNPGTTFKEMFAGIDPQVSVMSFEKDGKPIGAIFNFALHQCCCDLPGALNNKYTGDFSSIVAKELKEIYGNDFVCLFLQGTAGDINHVDTDFKKPRIPYVEIGEQLAKKVNEAMQTATPVGEGISVKKERIVLQKRLSNSKYVKDFAAKHLGDASLFSIRMRNLVYYTATNTDTEVSLWLQTIKIGNTVLYCMPGEIYVDFGLELKERAESENVMVVEFCNDYCGYIPTKRAFAENCDFYETSLCHHSCLEPDAGDKMVARLLEMQA